MLAKGQTQRALVVLEGALPIEQRLGLPVGPPSRPFKPVVELYGEVLLEAGRPEDAQKQFMVSLRRTPNRAASLIGLARAAAKTGHTDTANRQYRAFLDLWDDADEDLETLEEARRWVSDNTPVHANPVGR